MLGAPISVAASFHLSPYQGAKPEQRRLVVAFLQLIISGVMYKEGAIEG